VQSESSQSHENTAWKAGSLKALTYFLTYMNFEIPGILTKTSEKQFTKIQ